MMNVRPGRVEKEVRHPARHDEDHANARDDKGQEERDKRQPREMPDGPWRRIMFSGQLFFQFVPVHCSICSSALRSLTQWSRRPKRKSVVILCLRKISAKKAGQLFARPIRTGGPTPL